MEEKVELANLLFELDKGEHTIPYEAWAEQILDAGWSKYLPPQVWQTGYYSYVQGVEMYLLCVSGRTGKQTAPWNVSWQTTATELQGQAYLSFGQGDPSLPYRARVKP